jgi:hypothetical protein
MRSRVYILAIACAVASLSAGRGVAEEVKQGVTNSTRGAGAVAEEAVRSESLPATTLTYRPGRDDAAEVELAAWGRRYYGRPYAGYYYPGPARYYSGYRGYYRPYYGSYPDNYYYGPPRYRYYDYPYGTARVGPLRFYWR